MRLRGRFSAVSLMTLGALLLSVMTVATQGTLPLGLGDVVEGVLSCGLGLGVGAGGGSNVGSSEASCSLSSLEWQVLADIRFPRIFMALITGAGLAMTGAILQSVTRNPLADPYLFGISSGAALGAVVAISALSGVAIYPELFGLSELESVTDILVTDISVTAGALIGAALSVVLMLVLAGRAAAQVETLLLSGVAVSFMLSALTSLVIYFSTPDTATTLLFWLMGSFTGSQWDSLMLPVIFLCLCLLVFLLFAPWLQVLQLGDDSASALGVPVYALRLSMLLLCSAMTAVLVAEVGGIGFVGLMIPHICRLLVGARLPQLLMMSALLGGVFMVWVDYLANALLTDQVLPVGIVTSALGSVFFFLILKGRHERS